MELTLYDTSGGDLSLNFLNTTDYPGSNNPSDNLNTYADILLWAFEGGAITAQERAQLAAQAAVDPHQAGEVLQKAREVRAALFRILTGSNSMLDLDLFNRLLARALAHRKIELSPPPARWTLACDPLPLDYPLWPVMLAAADILTSPDLERVHTCANHECGWIFLDRSRNGSRKWCSSTSCGNRERVRQYYARKR
jgi:predicted RNA-binding Zn ribbon-like protein